MVTVGVCGGSGSGKGVLCRILEENGVPVFDCDAVYHELIAADSAVTRELISLFGEEIRAEQGGIDRRRLSEIVFALERADALRCLNEVTHRHVRLVALSWLQKRRDEGKEAAVVDAPLLFESGFDALCDLTVAVIAPRELRISRIMKRDRITREAAQKRVNAQISDAELCRRADTVIQNGGDEAMLRLAAEKLMNMIKEKHK